MPRPKYTEEQKRIATMQKVLKDPNIPDEVKHGIRRKIQEMKSGNEFGAAVTQATESVQFSATTPPAAMQQAPLPLAKAEQQSFEQVAQSDLRQYETGATVDIPSNLVDAVNQPAQVANPPPAISKVVDIPPNETPPPNEPIDTKVLPMPLQQQQAKAGHCHTCGKVFGRPICPECGQELGWGKEDVGMLIELSNMVLWERIPAPMLTTDGQFKGWSNPAQHNQAIKGKEKDEIAERYANLLNYYEQKPNPKAAVWIAAIGATVAVVLPRVAIAVAYYKATRAAQQKGSTQAQAKPEAQPADVVDAKKG